MKRFFIILFMFTISLFSQTYVSNTDPTTWYSGTCPVSSIIVSTSGVSYSYDVRGSLDSSAQISSLSGVSSNSFQFFKGNNEEIQCTYYTYDSHSTYNYRIDHYFYQIIGVYNPPPTCSQNQHVDTNSNTCVSDPGYHMDGNNSVPDVTCPSSMKYKYVAMPSFQFDIKTCVPDSNISESDCLQNSNNIYLKPTEYLDDERFQGYLVYGSGCVDRSYLASQAYQENFSFLVSGLLPSISGKFLFKFGNTLGNLFARGSNYLKDIFSKYKTVSGSNLVTHQPKIIDMSIGSDGVYYNVNLDPKAPTPPPDKPSWADVYSDFINNGWDFPKASSDPSPDVPDFKVNEVDFPNVSNDDFFYKGSDTSSFKDADIGTANIAKYGSVPDIDSKLSTPLNTQFDTTTSFNPSAVLESVPSVSYPTKLAILDKSTLSDSTQIYHLSGKVNYPDGSFSDITIKRTINPNLSGFDEVVVSHKIDSISGNDVTLKNSFTNSFDNGGSVTSTINDPAEIVTNGSGGTTSTTNNPDPTTISQDASLDLTYTNNKLNSMDQSLNQIKNDIHDVVNYKPADFHTAESGVNDFKNAFNVYDVNFNDYHNFMNTIINNMSNLKTQFENLQNAISNKPVIHQIIGTCGFNVTLYGTTHNVDICPMVSRYRPILTVIFTLFMTLGVLMFAFKYIIV